MLQHVNQLLRHRSVLLVFQTSGDDRRTSTIPACDEQTDIQAAGHYAVLCILCVMCALPMDPYKETLRPR